MKNHEALRNDRLFLFGLTGLLLLGLCACRSPRPSRSEVEPARSGSASTMALGVAIRSGLGYVRVRADGPPVVLYVESDGGSRHYKPDSVATLGDCTMQPGVKYRLDFGPTIHGRVVVTITNTSDAGDSCTTEADVVLFGAPAAAPAAATGSAGYVRVRDDGPGTRVPVDIADATTVDHVRPEGNGTIGSCSLQGGVKYRLVIKWIGTWRVSVSVENTSDRSDVCTTEVDVVPFTPSGASPTAGGVSASAAGYVRVETDGPPVVFLLEREEGRATEFGIVEGGGSLGSCTLQPDVKYRFVFTWIGRNRVSVTVYNTSDASDVCTSQLDVMLWSAGGTAPSPQVEDADCASSGRIYARDLGPLLTYYWNAEADGMVALVVRPEVDAQLGACALEAGAAYLVQVLWEGADNAVARIEPLDGLRSPCVTEIEPVRPVRAGGGRPVVFYTQEDGDPDVMLTVHAGESELRLPVGPAGVDARPGH